jgi:hypothetical protein
MKLDPGIHIVKHLVFFGKSGVTLSLLVADKLAGEEKRRGQEGGGRAEKEPRLTAKQLKRNDTLKLYKSS